MNWRRNLWSLWFAVILSSSSYTMVVPFLPLYLLDLGVSPKNVNLWSGVIFSVTFLVAGLMAPYWGRCADKSGKRRMVIRAGLSLAAVYFLGALVRNPVELLIVRILQGFANGFFPASMAIVAASAPQDKMGYSLGLMQTATVTGGILGPLLGGILSHFFGMRSSFVMAATAIFFGTIAVRLLVSEVDHDETPNAGGVTDDLRTAFNNRKLMEMLLLLFAVQMISLVLQPLITLYVAELQGQFEGVVLTSGIVFSLAGIAGAIAAPIWGRIGQKKGFFKILAMALVGAGIFNTAQFFATNIYHFGLLQFLFGLFIVGVYPAINTIVVAYTDSCFQGRAFGLTTTANQLGAMTGPLIGGIASSWMGIRSIFPFTGGMLCLAGLIIWLRYRLQSKKQAVTAHICAK